VDEAFTHDGVKLATEVRRRAREAHRMPLTQAVIS
jgi:hypothetical protein